MADVQNRNVNASAATQPVKLKPHSASSRSGRAGLPRLCARLPLRAIVRGYGLSLRLFNGRDGPGSGAGSTTTAALRLTRSRVIIPNG